MDVKLFRSGTRKWRIGLINGPNMPNLHNRSPDVYGPPQTIEQLEQRNVKLAEGLGV